MIIYTVRPGDSLYSIARRYNTTVDRLAADNALASPSVLSAGQSLVILQPETTYTVRPGDTLYSIAGQYGVSVNQLWRNNPSLAGSDVLTPGQQLFISLEPPEFDREVSVTGYVYPFVDRSTLTTALPYLTYLSVFTYGLNPDGSLIPQDDDELISLARSYGVAPIMMIASLNNQGLFSNQLASDILSDPALRNAVVDNIYNTVRSKGYSGVEFDFEYVPAQNAADYAELVRATRERLSPEGYYVFVDLAPKESDDKPGLLYEGHDYAALGEAADLALLMTYEYGYTYGPPMAVSPIGPVSGVLDYAVTRIPSLKLLLGEPNYAYNWTLPYVQGESRAESLSNVEAVELAAEKRAAIEYDEVAQSPYFNYYDRTDAGPVQHEVWFEDARSADASLRLIDSYDLAGTGIWNIMRKNPQLYLVLNSLYQIKKVLG
ncbi:MAG: LysM peptidoglycan-binding domain-containing protein [Eubacteriales bacterium]|nr:LysM peptidoglycan-binding domain-containing protein [Eubacteriales bacterium]